MHRGPGGGTFSENAVEGGASLPLSDVMSARGVLVWAQKNGGPRPSDAPEGSRWRRRSRGHGAVASTAGLGGDWEMVSSDVPASQRRPAAPPGVTAGGAALRARSPASRPRVAAPLAPGAASSPASSARPKPARRAGGVMLGLRGVSLVALAAGIIGALLSAGAHAGGVAFSGRIAAGCDELASCQTLEAEAESRAAECLLFCGRAEAEHRAARLMRYRAEERRAVRDHYRARERAEQLERERAQARARDERERRESARAQEAAREHSERLELEQLRQASFDRRVADERQRRAGYYAALGAEGRARRMERCLERHERCDALAIDLLEAARDEDERRALAQLNERVPTPPRSNGAPDTALAASTTPSGDAALVSAPAEPVGRAQPTTGSMERRSDGQRNREAPALAEPATQAAAVLPSS